ncbi:MAG: prolyl oligopeptidase family serine peptidase [Porticoccaceae bacterium]
MNQSLAKQRTCGSWRSPITPELMTAARPTFDYPLARNNKLYWLESRPWENGRTVVVEKDQNNRTRDIVPAPLSVRSQVHEYGGTPYIIVGDTLYFCLQDDQRIYRLDTRSDHAIPQPVTPAPEENGSEYRFADFCYDENRHRLICVCEVHQSSQHEPENFIAAIPLTDSSGTNTIEKLVYGNDFYAYPRISPDGHQLCWVSWDHPNMPWDSSQLYLADIQPDGTLAHSTLIAGEQPQSIFQPEWSPHGELHFVSDISNWWNIYRIDANGKTAPVCTLDAEFATPLWVLGMSTYGFCDDSSIVCCYSQRGEWQLAIVANGCLTNIDSPYTQIAAIHCAGQKAWFIGAANNIEAELASCDLNQRSLQTEQRPEPLPFESACLSQPQAIDFATGTDCLSRAHGFYYPATHPDYCVPEGEKPPLIVMCHGGPTGATSTALNLKIQFWTSRGFAVLDVNYRGSTGYGREYRQQLNGAWGIADIEDVVAGTRHIIAQGLADPHRVAIRGSSAGGYTVLAALTFTDTFKAGACLYGIGDLETLATDTHKFESRYLDQLIGPYPETKAIYQQRSPFTLPTS